jgi:hypothetical protein
MALIVGHNGPSSYAGTIANRTGQSGGSVGGVKKAGTVQYGATWGRGNMGNYLRRAPQGCCDNNIFFAITKTTRNPVQRNRNGYGVGRGQM